MTTKLVDVEQCGRVLIIRMQREDKRNAIDRQLADELDAAFNTLDDDPELWAGVLTGSDTVFSAGSDLTSGGDYWTERGGEYGLIRRDRHTPLIAAVEGVALGGGFELALACDVIVASHTAKFGLPEVARGLIPTCGGLFRGPRQLPANLARELVLTGDPIGVERAHAVGLVSVVTVEHGALTSAVELAARITQNSPIAVQAGLRSVNRWLGMFEDEGWSRTEDAKDTVLASSDHREGIAAFLERRSPVWTGA